MVVSRSFIGSVELKCVNFGIDSFLANLKFAMDNNKPNSDTLLEQIHTHYSLAQVKAIQEEINRDAVQSGRPTISLINLEEENRIFELIEANTWPEGWTGEEPGGDLNIPLVVTKDLHVLQNQLLA